ncbi:hypothetical protein H6A66_17110, partial [Bacteroides caecigallinarum]|nr:hypothetical protein [Bacteroides caecigallinarum]
PNKEVKEGFLSLVAAGYFNTRESISSWIDDAVDYLKEGRIEEFVFNEK